MSTPMPWVKLYTDFLDDRKIGRLPDGLKLRFIQLILVAGECDADGCLMDGNGAISLEEIAWRIRVDHEQLVQDVSDLATAGLLSEDVDTGAILILNFSKRQGRSQSVKREQWRNAQQRKREQEQRQQHDSDGVHADVIDESSMTHTPREEKRREEKSREEEPPQLFSQLSTAFVTETKIPELTGGVEKWVEAVNQMVKAGVTVDDMLTGIRELRRKPKYKISGPWSVVNAAVIAMSERASHGSPGGGGMSLDDLERQGYVTKPN